MKYEDIVADLKKNNAKSTGFYTTEQLLEIFNHLITQLDPQAPPARAVL